MSRFLILYLASLTLRSLIVAAFGGLVTLRMRSVAGRHAVWTAVVCCMLLMPVADAVLPPSMVPAQAPQIVLPVQTFVSVDPAATSQSRDFAAIAPVPQPVKRDGWQVAASLWIVIAGVLSGRFGLALVQIARIKRAGVAIAEGLIPAQSLRFRKLAFRESAAVSIPLTVGVLQPILILPPDWREWDEWKLCAVLRHELTHVRRMDWAIAAVATFARCVFWFNPLTWWLERQLSSLAEQASDEACVQSTGDAPRYAETLLQFACMTKRGRRWTGGVAMAQYKISFRIERVLQLQKAGSGLLSKAGWCAASMLAMVSLYVSAAAQSRTTTQLPPLSTGEIVRMVQQTLPSPEPPAAAPVTPTQQLPQPAARPASPEVLTPTARAGVFQYFTGWVPVAPQTQHNAASPFPPTAPPVDPSTAGELRLLLTPFGPVPPQGAAPGQVQVQTSTGNNRYTGTAVWNVSNNALNANSWVRNGSPFAFAMTRSQGRTLFFETSQGGTFSYGCSDCSFLASELGVSALPADGATGIVLRLSDDGKSVGATCRAALCMVSLPAGIRSLRESETMEFAVPQPALVDPSKNSAWPPNARALRCFSVFGNVKADGTPFTAADCPGGLALTPPSAVFFSVPR